MTSLCCQALIKALVDGVSNVTSQIMLRMDRKDVVTSDSRA